MEKIKDITTKVASGLRKFATVGVIGMMLVPSVGFAAVKKKKTTRKKAKVTARYKTRHTSNPTRQTTYADGLKIKKDLLMIDRVQAERAFANDAIPADDLYGALWDNQHVNMYGSLDSIPPVYTIDLKGFVIPVEGIVTSKFGPRWGRQHKGIDLNLNTGDPVYAAFDGKVRMCQYDRGGYGYYVVIRHHNGLETVYGHLSNFLVHENQNVKAGDVIGLGGSTGRSTGPHLHFETRFLGRAIDPSRIIDFDNKVCHRDTYVVNTSSFSPLRSSSYESYAKSSVSKYSKKGYKARTLKVKKGDTLAKIARRNGVSVKKLASLNGISTKKKLSVGQRLRIG